MWFVYVKSKLFCTENNIANANIKNIRHKRQPTADSLFYVLKRLALCSTIWPNGMSDVCASVVDGRAAFSDIRQRMPNLSSTISSRSVGERCMSAVRNDESEAKSNFSFDNVVSRGCIRRHQIQSTHIVTPANDECIWRQRDFFLLHFLYRSTRFTLLNVITHLTTPASTTKKQKHNHTYAERRPQNTNNNDCTLRME